MHPTVRRLERVPPEIWQEIIAFACTDGGATGRSIALTCRFFREQSLHVRFTSLSFKNTKSLLVFLVSLRVQPKDCRPRIQHVALEPSFYTGHIPRALRHLAGNPQPGQEVDPIDFCANAIEALISLAARQLRTLCLVAQPAVPFRRFAHVLPKLEELSVWNHPLCPPQAPIIHQQSESRGGEVHASPLSTSAAGISVSGSDDEGRDSDRARVSSEVLLPSLRRLHYVLTEPNMSFRNVLASLPALASAKLTHLRLSGITYVDEDVPRILAYILGVPPPQPLRERVRLGASTLGLQPPPLDTSGAVFPNLRHVVLYAIQPGRDDMMSFPKWATLLGLLRELERTCKRVSGMRMVVLERSWLRKSKWTTRLKDDWLQRMDGGRGCWVESEAEESRIEGPLEAPKGVEW